MRTNNDKQIRRSLAAVLAVAAIAIAMVSGGTNQAAATSSQILRCETPADARRIEAITASGDIDAAKRFIDARIKDGTCTMHTTAPDGIVQTAASNDDRSVAQWAVESYFKGLLIASFWALKQFIALLF